MVREREVEWSEVEWSWAQRMGTGVWSWMRGGAGKRGCMVAGGGCGAILRDDGLGPCCRCGVAER